MNPHDSHFHGNAAGSFQASPFSAFHFLRNYNYLLPPEPTECPLQSPNSDKIVPVRAEADEPLVNLPPKSYWQQSSLLQNNYIGPRSNLISPYGAIFGANYKRHRGEKKPIPDEQKDDKYFERRKRNNQAAKKSRDARKLREDQIALRAAILEHENAILRAQVLTLRDEASTLRQLLLEKKAGEF